MGDKEEEKGKRGGEHNGKGVREGGLKERGEEEARRTICRRKVELSNY